MAWDDAPPEQPREITAMIAEPRRPAEPVYILGLGIALFLGLLVLGWTSSGSRVVPSPMASAQARMATYLIAYLQHLADAASAPQRPALQSRITAEAARAAVSWRTLASREADPSTRAKLLLNAAALYGHAGQASRALKLLHQAAEVDPPRAAAYRALAPLYADVPRAVDLAPAEPALAQAATAPFWRARDARVRGDETLRRAEMAPAVARGSRVLVVSAILLTLLFGIVVASISIAAVRLAYPRAQTTAPTPEPAWGPGTALIVVSLTLLMTMGLASLFTRAAERLGMQPDMVARMTISMLAESISVVIVLGGFLMLLGRAPWAWGIFGWRRERGALTLGISTLVMLLPVIWALALGSAALLGDKFGTHPLTPRLMATTNFWAVVIMGMIAVVMAPLIEETLFRGVIFRALAAAMRPWPAMLISGAIFAAIHFLPGYLLPVTVLGAMLAWLARRGGTLYAPAAAHALFNAISVMGTLLLGWAMQGM